MEANKGYYGDKKNIIIQVEPQSIADEMGVEPGDILISVNHQLIKDVFDYRFFIKDEYVEIIIEKPDGAEWILEIDKDEDEDIGIIFENGLMDNAKSCNNKCIFCFIDQLPQGMRKTLYFKDDDSRLSFLQGNYVTLTNMKEEDLDRILYYKLSPINISVHTTDMTLREFMLKNPHATRLLEYLDKIMISSIEMNFQVVLLKGINDGEHLNKSIRELSKYIPSGKSLSIVPAGLTKYRQGLYPIEAFSKKDAYEIIKTVEDFQKQFIKTYDTRFVYAADEFYINAGIDFPPYDKYEDFPQIENGVGMAASFIHEANVALSKPRLFKSHQKVTIVTGVAAASFIKVICRRIKKIFGVEISLCVVSNVFFGQEITVSGLLCARDIIDALKAFGYHKKILIPKNCLKDGEDVFLDDITLSQMSRELGATINPVEACGQEFVNAILK